MPAKPRRFSYDARCEDLAEYFLSDEAHDDEHVQKLAQTIQDAIEDWLREKNDSKGDSYAETDKPMSGR
jgi:hexokinase